MKEARSMPIMSGDPVDNEGRLTLNMSVVDRGVRLNRETTRVEPAYNIFRTS